MFAEKKVNHKFDNKIVKLLAAIVEEGSYDEDIGQYDGYPHDENDTGLR